MTLHGRDSYHNNSAPNSMSMAGKSFWILKATQGNGFHDPEFHSRLAVVEKASLIGGAYHFGELGAGTGLAQANYFLDYVGSTKGMLLALDFEREPTSGTTMSVTQARDFITQVHARTGQPCALYSYVSGYPSVGQDWRWVAHPGTPPSIPWDVWQNGADSYGDLNQTNHDLAWLQAMTGGDAGVSKQDVLDAFGYSTDDAGNNAGDALAAIFAWGMGGPRPTEANRAKIYDALKALAAADPTIAGNFTVTGTVTGGGTVS